MTDWIEWHRACDKPGSSLGRPLLVVGQRIQESVVAMGPDARRLLSLCSGDGRDVIHVLAGLPPDQRPDAILVDFAPDLRPQIRRWFVDAGLAEVHSDGDPEPFGVGVSRLVDPRTATDEPLPKLLFVFVR